MYRILSVNSVNVMLNYTCFVATLLRRFDAAGPICLF